MIGAGHAIHEMTKSWLEKKEERAVVRGIARIKAQAFVTFDVQHLLVGISGATPGSSYRIELELYLDRMLTALSNGEKFDEPMPDPDDQS